MQQSTYGVQRLDIIYILISQNNDYHVSRSTQPDLCLFAHIKKSLRASSSSELFESAVVIAYGNL